MTIDTELTSQRGMLKIELTGAASTANGGQGEFYNPEGVDLLIIRTFAYFRTGSTGAANLDVGVAATGVKGTDILSTFDAIEATVGGKAFYCQAVSVNETEEAVVWEDDEYITFTASATLVGLDADFYVEYLRLAEAS